MAANASIALLLEDEPLISIDIELTLEGAGFGVTTVMSCKEADAWLDGNTSDIVIVDIVLRDGPCHHVVSRLVDASIPFVVHSGDHPNQHNNTPFMHGSWVSKPASSSVLVDAARALLAEHLS